MEGFKKSLFEVYLNYDTLQYLKEENQSNEEIISMFKDELDYDKDLTKTLLKYDKSFLKSIAMRIKLKIKNEIEVGEIKDELLSYDDSLSPLLEKLITSSEFKKQFNTISKNNLIEENSNVENNYNDIEVKETSSIDSFLDTKIQLTSNTSDILKVSDLYKIYCEYCEENDLDKLAKHEFKNFLSEKLGKCSKNGYVGYILKTIN